MASPGAAENEFREQVYGQFRAIDRTLNLDRIRFLAELEAIKARLDREQPLDDEEDRARLERAAGMYQSLADLNLRLMQLHERLENEKAADEQLLRDIRTMYQLLQQCLMYQTRQEQTLYFIRTLVIIGVTAVFMLTGLVVFLRLLERRYANG